MVGSSSDLLDKLKLSDERGIPDPQPRLILARSCLLLSAPLFQLVTLIPSVTIPLQLHKLARLQSQNAIANAVGPYKELF
jgi:hypothetical protein